jgi:glutathione S-transferase
MPRYTLYWSSNSAALAPQICLEEAGAEYETRLVPINEVPQKDPGYLKLNPAGKVPTLVVDDVQVIYESAAICLYLADRHPDARLMPKSGDPALGGALQWLVFLTNTLQPAILRFYYPERHTTDSAGTKAVSDRALEEIATLWGRIDDHLGANGPYFTGPQFSACDAFAFMLSNWRESCPELPERCTNVTRLANKVRARAAVQRILKQNELAT